MTVKDIDACPVYRAGKDSSDVRIGYSIEYGQSEDILEIRSIDEIDYLIKKLKRMKKEWLLERESESEQ